jgi:antitoxin HicB
MQISVARSTSELGRVKRAMVRDLRTAMRRKQVSQAVLARRISTSRSAIGRLLKAEDSSLTLRLLGRIAVALGARVNLRLAERTRRRPTARKRLS